jgi:hypothetical protein
MKNIKVLRFENKEVLTDRVILKAVCDYLVLKQLL